MGVISTCRHRASAATLPVPTAPNGPPRPAGRRPRVFVRTATTYDLSAMAGLHVAHLPIGFFPRLGTGFVARWQAAFLDSPHAIGLVAIKRSDDASAETVVGFLVGTTDRRAFRRELLRRHRGALIRHGLFALVARPRLLATFLRCRATTYAARLWRGRSGTPTAQPLEREEPVGELTAVAVDPGARGAGVGRRLIEIYLDRCTSLGVSWVELVTATEPDSAVRFYEHTGWTWLHRSRTRDGVPVAHFGRCLATTDCA